MDQADFIRPDLAAGVAAFCEALEGPECRCGSERCKEARAYGREIAKGLRELLITFGPECPISWCNFPMPHNHAQGTCGPMPLTAEPT